MNAKELNKLINLLYDNYGSELYYYANSMLNNELEAEDAMQNLFLNLVENREKLKEVSNWKNYLLKSIRNESLKIIRSSIRRKNKISKFSETIKLEYTLKDEIVLEEDKMILERALATIPEEQRLVLILKHFSGLKFREISEIMEINIDTVSSRYKYAMDKLKKMFFSKLKKE